MKGHHIITCLTEHKAVLDTCTNRKNQVLKLLTCRYIIATDINDSPVPYSIAIMYATKPALSASQGNCDSQENMELFFFRRDPGSGK
jgi:hypothetical protein